MPVGVAHQVVDQVHHVVGVGVLLQHEGVPIQPMIDAVHVHRLHGDEARIFGSDDAAPGNRLPLKGGRLIGHTLGPEAARDLRGQQLGLYVAFIAVLQEIECAVLPNPRLRRNALRADISGRVVGLQQFRVLNGKGPTVQTDVGEGPGQRMPEQAEIGKADILPVELDPVHVGQAQPVIGNGDGGTVAIRHGLLGSDAVQDLLGEPAIQGQDTGGTPIVEIVQVVEPRVQIIRRLQIEIVGHKGRGIDRAGAVLADGRDLAILVHDRKPLPALGKHVVIDMNAHFSISSNSASSFSISTSSALMLARISLVGGYSTGLYSVCLYLLMERS